MSLHELFKSIGDAYKDDLPLRAIWLSKPVMTLTGRTYKVEPGDYVTVKDGQLIDLSEKATHIVEACSGAMEGRNSIHLRNLETSEQLTIKI